MTKASRWAERSRFPALIDALGLAAADEPARRLLRLFGDEPASSVEHDLGEPAVRVRTLRFASGGEIVLHDEIVVGAILHVKGADAVDLADWIDGVTGDATLKELEDAFGLKARFSGFNAPYFALGDGHALMRFDRVDGKGGWKDPGHLSRIVVMAGQPGLTIAPDADECPTCGDLLVRGEQGLDIDETVARLQTAVTAKDLREDAFWAKLGDLRAIHASGLMRLVESQFDCRTCRRVICFTLHRDGSPTFTYCSTNEARQRPMEPIPPVEKWGSPKRQAVAREAMQYVDHHPGAWFLVRQGDRLYLDARYSYSAIIDDSALIELDTAEREAYRRRGRDYLNELAERIHMSAPYQEKSPYYARDLRRRGGDPDRDYRGEVSAAILNHTWLAAQRASRA